MNGDDGVERALRALREADADRGAQDATKTRVAAAFRAHHARRRQRRASWWQAAAVAACAAIGFAAVWQLSSPAAVQAPEPVVAVAADPAVPPSAGQQAEANPAPEKLVVAKAPRRQKARPARIRAVAAPQAEAPAEAETGSFFALPFAPPFTARDYGQVMRVRLPRHSLRSLGLPVNEERLSERVPADLLLGEDGVPRAIRFTSYR